MKKYYMCLLPHILLICMAFVLISIPIIAIYNFKSFQIKDIIVVSFFSIYGLLKINTLYRLYTSDCRYIIIEKNCIFLDLKKYGQVSLPMNSIDKIEQQILTADRWLDIRELKIFTKNGKIYTIVSSSASNLCLNANIGKYVKSITWQDITWQDRLIQILNITIAIIFIPIIIVLVCLQ